MEWTESIRGAIDYMEAHLLEAISPEDVARAVHLSPFYLQRGFEMMTGYSISRYLRYRRLYLAALDLAAGKGRVLDAALRYGFETPESFAKAFSRFHGATPTQAMRDHSRIKTFLPLKITLSIQGGEHMEYAVERMEGFRLVGFAREIPYDRGYQDCPDFWEEFSRKYRSLLLQGEAPETPEEYAAVRYQIGEFAACIDGAGRTEKPGAFRYLIAGRYDGGPVPEGMAVFRFPDMEWAKFPCRGPLPGALQAVNTRIFQEWLPGNREYGLAMGANIEWYSQGPTDAAEYESAIWVPVKKQ